jgi:hypothetical protein
MQRDCSISVSWWILGTTGKRQNSILDEVALMTIAGSPAVLPSTR